MGVLDDAIRDHLDLKRRRGADPAEIERAEREALGPVRRGPEPVSEEAQVGGALPYDDEDVPAPAFEQPGDELEEDEFWEDEFEGEWDEPEAEHPPLEFEPPPVAPVEPSSNAPVEPPAAAPAEPAAAVPPAPAPEAAPAPHPALPPDPEPVAPEPHPAPTRRQTSDETVEYRVEDALPPEERQEDMLEETPEFLQDTPDHDRLWFEQRPPRDFDFDG